MAFIIDSELGTIETPNGNVQFLQIVGLTSKEYDDFKQSPNIESTERILKKLKIGNELLITDLDRK